MKERSCTSQPNINIRSNEILSTIGLSSLLSELGEKVDRMIHLKRFSTITIIFIKG